MENVNIVLAENILKYRKKCGLSQVDLANKLGVTFQAVSKWENAKAAPDITFLPIMADIFGCNIDDLFGRTVKTEIHFNLCTEIPFPDDTIVREVLCNGRKIIKINILLDKNYLFYPNFCLNYSMKRKADLLCKSSSGLNTNLVLDF